MPGIDEENKSKRNHLLSRLSICMAAAACALMLAVLVFLGVNTNLEVQSSRSGDDTVSVVEASCREVLDGKTPTGIAQLYTFTVKEMERDTCLSFYTVHQYAEVYIDGQLVHSMKPSGKLLIKTIGSNWSVIPLYREDAGKEICVKIIPVYDSFRNREVQFLLGSKLGVFLQCLKKDWPQLILSMIAIFVGIIFVGAGIYKVFSGHFDSGLASLGMFSVMTGLWRLTDTRFTPFLAPEKPVLMFYISVAMMMLGPVPMIQFMKARFRKTSRKIFDGYCIAVSLLCMIQLILQIFCGVDLREKFYIIHMVIGLTIAVFIGNGLCEYIRHLKNGKGNLGAKSALILIVGVVADVAAYYITGTSSGLIFSLIAMIIYTMITGIQMMDQYIRQEKQFARQERALAESEKQIAKQERALAESRISTMISQIRPHFIYNTLGSIEQLCELHPEAAAKLVHNFACYLRGNFSELDNHGPIHLSKELEHIKYYVSIEKVRFPDMEIRFDLHTDDFLIPALSVQPLVENAIKHGLMKIEKGGTVVVSSYETDSCYCVSVTDNGAGFDTSVLLDDQKHIGLRNIRGRLEAMCGGRLVVESTPGIGTKVEISIPKGVEEK